MMILSFPDYLNQAQRLAIQLHMQFAEISLHRFPDGESLVRLPPTLPEHVIFYRSLNQPNDKLIELVLAATTARELGAKRISLVAPYLSYMRQDIAFQPGEAVSQRIIGKLLADLFDDVITVEAHLHRISSLSQVMPIQNAISLSAGEQIGHFLQTQFSRALLLGPDSESEQWVAKVADAIKFDYMIAGKERLGDTLVEMTLPDRDISELPVIIIDDMTSTGRTLSKAASLLQAQGCKNIYAVVTHALFCGDAYNHILDSGIKNVWSTDSINHSTSCITLDGLLADAILSITR